MKIIDLIVEKLERRISISKLTKVEDLQLSNSTLNDIKRAIKLLKRDAGIREEKGRKL